MILGDANAVDSSINQSSNESTLPVITSSQVPALGRYWQMMCSLRLLISQSANLNKNVTTSIATPTTSISNFNNKNGQRTIRILKSNQLKTDTYCAVMLTDAGII